MHTSSPTRLIATAGLALALAPLAAAQPFNKLVGLSNNEFGNFITQTRDGGFAVTGFTQLPNTPDRGDILVNKHRPDGSLEWSVVFGGPETDTGYCIQQTTDGGYIIAAETSSLGPVFNLALLRLDAAGNYLWSRGYEGDLSGEDSVYAPLAAPGVSVRELRSDNGGFVLTGRKRLSEGLQDQLGVLIRTAPSGVPVFNRQYADGVFEDRTRLSFTDVRELPDGTLIVSGTEELANSPVEARDPFAARFDPAGNPLWMRRYPLAAALNASEHGTGDGLDFIPGPNGGIVIAGRADLGTINAFALHALRIDFAGNPAWYRIYQNMNPAFRATHIDQFGRVAIGGTVRDAAGALDAMLLRLDPNTGNFGSGRAYGYMDVAAGMGPAPLSGGYALVGSVVPPAPLGFGGFDIEMIVTDGAGHVPCLVRDFVAQPITLELQQQGVQWQIHAGEAVVWQGQYRRWQQRVEVICEDRCRRADFNSDGNIDPDDLSDFITCFFLAPPCPQADFNSDGNVDPDDLSDYITLFFSCV